MSGPRLREALALALLLVVLVTATFSWARSRQPDEVDRIVERVMVRLGTDDMPPGVASPSGTPSCQPVTVIDDYGFEVPITDCDPGSS